MSEQTLKRRVVDKAKRAQPSFEFIRHEDRFYSGVPDLSMTGLGKTTWWEFKYANPGFESPGIQKLTLKRMAKAGYARYVVFRDGKNGPETLIVHPRDIETWSTDWEWRCDGFNVEALLQEMFRRHDCHLRTY